MDKHRVKGLFKTGGISRFARVFVIASLVIASIAGSSQPASAAQTWQNYCKQYTLTSLSACRDGVLGTVDCGEYADVSNQGDVTICNNAKAAKANGTITDTPTSTTTTPQPTDSTVNATAYRTQVILACASYTDTAQQLACLYGGLGQNGSSTKPSTNCSSALQYLGNPDAQSACSTGASAAQDYLNSQKGSGSDSASSGLASNTNNPFTKLDLNDTQGNLSSFIDNLHATGTDSKVKISDKVSNNPNAYVNGAGKQQPIKFWPSGKPNSPAIIWFNGGGWHSDDGTAYCLATGSSQKNCMPGTNGGADTSTASDNQNIGPPTGGGAMARGYTVIEVTYRLGSSGVNYMFEDVMRGVQHVINNAKLYGIDPNKIAIGGDSAGGSLSMRAVASGKSGAKVGIGWSAPTNGYTALFKSYKTFLLGMDHSTCIPTDLAGITNTTSLLTGGSGNVAQYGEGISSNDFSGLGLSQDQSGLITGVQDPASNALLTLGQVLMAAQYASSTSQNIESISKQIQNGGASSMFSGVFNLAASKLTECIQNFNTLSPALFASTETPPTFLADFDTDDVVDPQQAYDMRDKLLQMGIRAEALIIPGDAGVSQNFLGPTSNHLGYDPRFVCPTINFIDSVVQPGVKSPDCSKPETVTQSAPTNGSSGSSAGGNSTSSSSSSGGGSQGSGGSSNNNSSCTSGSQVAQPSGAKSGWTYSQACAGQDCPASASQSVPARAGLGDGNTAYCAHYTAPGQSCDTWDSRCNGGVSSSKPELTNGNFNPDIKLDTSNASTSDSPCGARGGYIARPDGSKAPTSDFYTPENRYNKIVCY